MWNYGWRQYCTIRSVGKHEIKIFCRRKKQSISLLQASPNLRASLKKEAAVKSNTAASQLKET